MNIVYEPDKVKITKKADGTIQLVFNIQAGDYSDENRVVYFGVKAGSENDGGWQIPDNQEGYLLTGAIEPVNPMNARGNNFRIDLNEGISPDNELKYQQRTECTVSQIFVLKEKDSATVEVVSAVPIQVKLENGSIIKVYCYNFKKRNPMPGEQYIEYKLSDDICEMQDPQKFEELNEALRSCLQAIPLTAWVSSI